MYLSCCKTKLETLLTQWRMIRYLLLLISFRQCRRYCAYYCPQRVKVWPKFVFTVLSKNWRTAPEISLRLSLCPNKDRKHVNSKFCQFIKKFLSFYIILHTFQENMPYCFHFICLLFPFSHIHIIQKYLIRYQNKSPDKYHSIYLYKSPYGCI